MESGISIKTLNLITVLTHNFIIILQFLIEGWTLVVNSGGEGGEGDSYLT